MKTLATVLVLVVAASSFGAVVNFVGPAAIAQGTPSVSFAITVAPDQMIGGQFNGGDLVIGWDQDGALSFDMDPAWAAAFTPAPGTPSIDNGIYTHDVWVSGANTTGAKFASIALGTITLDTAALQPGEYTLAVHPEYSLLGNGSLAAPVSDSVTFAVVRIPEPATMALLALGGLLIARRRHA